MIDGERLAQAMLRCDTRTPHSSIEWHRERARQVIAQYKRLLAEEAKGCTCCEDGYYCRHRCQVHPKANGLFDSGKPWVVEQGAASAERWVWFGPGDERRCTCGGAIGSIIHADDCPATQPAPDWGHRELTNQ